MDPTPSRYGLVSRRALLKASAAMGVALVAPTACGTGDAEVFAGALTDLATPPTTEPITTEPITTEPAAAEPNSPEPINPEPAAAPEPAQRAQDAEAAPTEVPAIDVAAPEPTAPAEPTATSVPPQPQLAVTGELVISFTYTQGPTGKNERPYIAVWIEDEAGELLDTVALWYQQARRGERWLDHLDRWWAVDQNRVVGGGVDDAATISSATRVPGAYAVAWDGTIEGVPVDAGRYFICIEAAREEGPYSLIREPFDLAGSLIETSLPASEELSAATVRIDA